MVSIYRYGKIKAKTDGDTNIEVKLYLSLYSKGSSKVVDETAKNVTVTPTESWYTIDKTFSLPDKEDTYKLIFKILSSDGKTVLKEWTSDNNVTVKKKGKTSTSIIVSSYEMSSASTVEYS